MPGRLRCDHRCALSAVLLLAALFPAPSALADVEFTVAPPSAGQAGSMAVPLAGLGMALLGLGYALRR